MSISPFVDSASWDVVKIGGVTCPGFCKLDKVERKHDFDRKKGKGTQGETITFVQKPAAEFKVTFYLWRSDHFDQWESFRTLLKYDPSKKDVSAIEIYHPALDDLDIHSVVTATLGAVKHEGKLLFSIEVDFLEYFPAAKTSATSTPTGSTQWTDAKGNKEKDGTQTLDDENKKLAKQAQKEGAI